MTQEKQNDAIEALNFIEREYLDYEDKNNKIKGMYIQLDKIRAELERADS